MLQQSDQPVIHLPHFELLGVEAEQEVHLLLAEGVQQVEQVGLEELVVLPELEAQVVQGGQLLVRSSKSSKC